MYRDAHPLRCCTAAPLAAAVGLLLSSGAGAHHSFAALFQMDTVAEIEGRITDVRWANPHIKIYVSDAAGETWEVEAGPVNLVARMGIDRDVLGVGDTIRVRGNPGRRDARTLWVSNILLANNVELLASPQAQPHWSSDTVGDASPFFAAGDAELPAGTERSLFGIWSPILAQFPRPREEPVLTPAGQREQPRYERGEQVIGDCELPGMPFAMMSPYPIEIIDEGERIVIRGEAYDLERVVHLEPLTTAPTRSPLGYSLAQLSADELVIETSLIDYHSFGDVGPAQSDQSHVVERFILSADGLALDYEITVTDPVMLAEPWAWGGAFVYRENAEVRPWNCGIDQLGSLR
jgi:hypothetical protein